MKKINPEQESTKGKVLSDRAMGNILMLFENKLNIPRVKPKKQFILCPVGLVGAGKTTVIKALSKKLSLLRISNDEIRIILKEKGYNLVRTREMVIKVAEKYLKQNYSLAIDADCISKKVQENIYKVEKRGIKIFWLHINPPESFIINKLKKFKHGALFQDAKNALRVYEIRKPLHKNINFPFIYEFDSSKSNLNYQIEQAVGLIKKELK